MTGRLVTHKPEWWPANLPINAAGDTRPGFVCVHLLENGNGPCGGNVFQVEDGAGDHACVVDDDRLGSFDLADDEAYQMLATDDLRERLAKSVKVREALDRLDGTPAAATALLTGLSVEELDEYGGMPKEEQ